MTTSQKLDFSSLKQALSSLVSALEITQSERFKTLDESWQQTLISGVIQNFEFSFELSWKMLKRQLKLELPNSSELDGMSYKELIRTGHERGLLSEPEAWFDYRFLRNITSHTYNKEKATQVYEGACSFPEHGLLLLTRLESRNHE